MATTDINGTPLLVLGAIEAKDLLAVVYGGAYTPSVDKLKKFLDYPEVVKWLKENS